MKKYTTVLLESIVIGLILAILYLILNSITPKQLFTLSINARNMLIIVVAGGLVHAIFEYTGLNKRYVDNYYKN